MIRLAAVAAALVGCPKPPPPEPFDWADTPRVPAPASGSYSRAVGIPADPGIASLVVGHTYDASLAGAAAGVGLALTGGRGGFTAPEVREAAWRAGWPYPISGAQVWTGDAGGPPPMGVVQWLAVQSASVGLVRVRGGLEEVWVGLASAPRVDLGPLPRQLPVGGALALPAVPGGRATVVDPAGRAVEGPLEVPWTTTVEQAGEWLVEVRDAGGAAALFPLYVGMVPPDLELLVPTPLPGTSAEAEALARRAVDRVRDAYGLSPLQEDPILQAAARAWQVDGSVPVAEVARRAGLAPSSAWRWTCAGTSVESCVDTIVWDVRARPGLLVADGLWGVVAEVSNGQVRLVAAVGAP